MKTLHELQQALTECRESMKNIHSNAGDKPLTDEQDTEFKSLTDKAQALQADIDVELKKRADDQRFAEGRSGGTGGDWVDTHTGERIPVYRSTDKIHEGDDTSGLNLGGFMKAAAIGAQTEEEKRALDSKVSASGGVTVPKALMNRWIDRMRDKSQVIAAGAQTVLLNAGETSIARLETDPVPAWRLENALVAESEPTFGIVNFSAKSLAVLVRASEEILQDSVNIDEILMSCIASAMAGELDRAALAGNGGTEEKPEPIGIANTNGILTLSETRTGGYAPIMVGCRELALNNSNTPTAAIMSPQDAFYFGGLTASDGQPLNKPPVISTLPLLDTGKASVNDLIIGDFTRLLIGLRLQMTVRILTERYADQLQIGFLCHLRADCAVEQPKSFCKVTLPAEARAAEPVSIPDRAAGKK